MEKFIKGILSIFIIALISMSAGFGQQSAMYAKARDVYNNAAAKTKCPERARVLREYANWNDCMVKLLASQVSSCGNAPTIPIPECSGDAAGGGGKANAAGNNASFSDPAVGGISEAGIQSLVESIGTLAEMKLDENKEANNWFLMSGGANFEIGTGVLSGTTSDLGKPAGYNVHTSLLSRKGVSLLFSFVELKSDYFHSFKSIGSDGISRHFIGRTKTNTSMIDFCIARDMISRESKFHFVPNIGVGMIYGIENNFTSTNYNNVTHTEEWDKDVFWAMQGGIQAYYFFSKRFAIQLGGKYNYQPNSYGSIFKTTSFGSLNLDISWRFF